MSSGGKGSKPRPFSVTQDEFCNNWDRIFSKKMKKNLQKTIKPVKLINPLNQESWWCLDYSKTHSVDGVEYIFVYKPENTQRQLLMRKDALRKVSLQ